MKPKTQYEYLKIEISRSEKKELRIAAFAAGLSFQKFLGSIVRQYLVNKVRG